MSEKPIVSIVAPAFNCGNYIKEFIECVIAQTFTEWELLLVDDGSTDNTVDTIKQYILKDDRIKLFVRKRMPKGSVTCRNIGQENCIGKYIMHLDSDDIVMPYTLEQRVSFMDNNPDIDFATFKGETIVIGEDGSLQKTGRVWGIDPGIDTLECFLTVNYPFSIWNNIYRASVFGDYYWDEQVKIYTDFSYIVPSLIGKYKHEFAKESKADYLYRVGQKNAMTSNFISGEKYDSTKYLFSKTMKQLQQLDNYKIYKKKFKRFFLLQLERVLINGKQEQVDDFYKYFCDMYSEDMNLRLMILCRLLLRNCKRKGHSRKMIRFWLYLLYDPIYTVKRSLGNS